ncbi:MAG TPA: FecR domain-containing protein [Pyrinomonadaceae bacterium]|jgi:hypothetical protein
MNEKHYREQLSAFVNHELAADEKQRVAEHLLQCAACRAEHDEIKLGAGLASALERADAPAELWSKIENSLSGKREELKTLAAPRLAFFGRRAWTAAAAFLIGGALAAALYLRTAPENAPERAADEPPRQSEISALTPPATSSSDEIASTQNTDQPAEIAPDLERRLPNGTSTAETNIKNPPKVAPPQGLLPAPPKLPAWNVETLAGVPKIGDSKAAGRLAVGEVLETDADARARVEVADIGNVEIAPNSRVRLVNTTRAEHRLALEKGVLKAKIFAPPRLFIVDTPSAAAIDLGCEYTLEVDPEGNSRLHVTSGFVALENGRFESIVPAGAIALTRKGKGVGTPFAEDASAKLQAALYRFDFENGGAAALAAIIEESNLYDSITLWHLLSRVEKTEREKVFDALSRQVKPPGKVTREGVLRLDKKMLAAWWTEIENVWFE